MAFELSEALGLKNLSGGLVFRGLAYLWLHSSSKIESASDFVDSLSQHQVTLRFQDLTLRFILDGEDITAKLLNPEITRKASEISVYPEIQAEVFQILEPFLKKGNVVLEGRNSGTSFCPTAEVKFFLTAEHTERVSRRQKQMELSGQATSFETLSSELWDRDLKDIERETEPLRVPEDAVVIDTTSLTPEEVFNRIIRVLEVRGYLEDR